MTYRFSRVLALLAVEACVSIASPASFAAPVIRFNPVWATDNVICLPGQPPCGETEIMLSRGDVEVTLFVEVSGWRSDQYGQPKLGAYIGTVNSDTYIGGDPSGVGTVAGFDLVPVGQPDNGFLGAFQALKVCGDCCDWTDMSDPVTFLSNCASNPSSCPGTAPFCVPRPDYVFVNMSSTPAVSTATLDYRWSASSTVCATDPNGRTSFYGGTLILHVPAGAEGTYNVNFKADPDLTLFLTCAGTPFPGLARTAGQITIGGACCMGDGTCELLPEDACAANGGSFFPTSCDVDTDGDGAPDVCDPCPIDNPDDSDGDGTCNSDDGCPTDPNKIEPGLCGCGVVDTAADSDGDGISDCEDQCPGVNDAVFAPDCVDAVPTVSTWGLIILSLILLTGGKIYFGYRSAGHVL